MPGFDFPSGYTAFQFVFVLLQAAAFGGVFTGFGIASDFENGFSRRLMLAAPNRLGILAGYTLAAMVRAIAVGVLLFIVAIASGMQVDGNGVDLFGLIVLALLVNFTAAMWAAGVAMRLRTIQAGPAMQMPVFIILFLAPVYVPLDLLAGWVEAVAHINPFTALVEGGRDLISGRTSTSGWCSGSRSGSARCSWPGRCAACTRGARGKLGVARGERLAEALAGRLQLIQGRRLLDHLEVDHALAERVQRVGADDRVQRNAALARAGADLADELALQRLLVELALAGDDGPRGAHALVEVQRLQDERRAGLAPRRARPTAPREAAGSASHRDAARVLRQALREFVKALLEPLDHRRVRPLLEPNTFGASSNVVRTSVRTTIFAFRSRRRLDHLERPGAAVGRRRPSHRDEDDLRAGVRRRRDELAGAIRARRPRVTLVLGHQPEPDRHRHLDDRRAAILNEPNPAFTGAPSGPRTSTAINSPPSWGSSASSVPSPPSATGHRSGGINPARSSPRPIAPATCGALNVPLNESGATRTGRSFYKGPDP